MRIYDKYCGDKDLWEKYSFGTVFYNGEPISEKQEILAIYKRDGFTSINLTHGSYPNCTNIKNNTVRILNGNKCDEIRLC